MSASFTALGEFRSCSGRAAVFAGEAREGAGVPELALASTLAERESGGQEIRVVVLRIASRDQGWVAPTVAWLAAHGRRVILRTAVPLSRSSIAAARREGVTVLLELAHAQPGVQVALLGPHAESTAGLLLHAQHLRACELEVAAWVGPLLPAVADDRALETLVRHIVAADLVDGHVVLGRLTPPRLEALTRVLPWPTVATMSRAFGIDPALPASLPAAGVHLSPMADGALRHAVARIAGALGLRLDHCGCPAQCHLDPEQRTAYVPLATPELFPELGPDRVAH
ncbi:MAG: hypothetical protein JNK45_12685 [Myxococcales bacterium]|nr:hypothetical protein [Myxococcales bacterium]